MLNSVAWELLFNAMVRKIDLVWVFWVLFLDFFWVWILTHITYMCKAGNLLIYQWKNTYLEKRGKTYDKNTVL